jgi:hypothetical protein
VIANLTGNFTHRIFDGDLTSAEHAAAPVGEDRLAASFGLAQQARQQADGNPRHNKGRRPHRSRQFRPPRPDHPAADLSKARIKRRTVLGGLINEYQRAT